MTRPKRLTTSLNSLGAKLFVAVFRTRSSKQPRLLSVPLFPCHLLEELGVQLVDSNRGIFAKGNLLLATSQPSTWGNQRGARSHQDNFWHPCWGLQSSR